jgi:hypothetical protein
VGGLDGITPPRQLVGYGWPKKMQNLAELLGQARVSVTHVGPPPG